VSWNLSNGSAIRIAKEKELGPQDTLKKPKDPPLDFTVPFQYQATGFTPKAFFYHMGPDGFMKKGVWRLFEKVTPLLIG
jgi:hypothetical protein